MPGRPPTKLDRILAENREQNDRLERLEGYTDDLESKVDDLIAVTSTGMGATAPPSDWRLVPSEAQQSRYVDVGKFVDVLVEETDAGPPALFLVDVVTSDSQTITLARDVDQATVDALLESLRVTP